MIEADSKKKQLERVFHIFLNTVEKNGMDEIMKSCGAVVAAYSGGADSGCMLYLLRRYCNENGIKLIAAHVNHMIRGEEADADEAFCRKQAEEYGICFELKKADVPMLAEKEGRGIEETARLVRYSFFDELAEKYGAVVATAHNASDNAETVVFNMLRGCGTHGLSGILPVRDGKFIRPLSELTGEEIRSFCKSADIAFVLDKTNTDTDYTRNYIRHVVMPTLERLNPNPAGSIAKMSGLIRADDDFLSSYALNILGDRREIKRDELLSLHIALSSRILRIMYDRAKETDSTIEEGHISDLLNLARKKSGESSLSLPGNMRAVIERERVYFAKSTEKCEQKTEFVYPRDGNVYENEMYRVVISPKNHNSHTELSKNDENIYKLSTLRSFDFDKIKGTLIIRNREQGDSYVYGGMRHRVKKMFVDTKMTLREKSLHPIICDDDGILWVPNFSPRDGTAENKAEVSIVISVYKKNE